MENWKYMQAFALALIRQSKNNLNITLTGEEKIMGERIAILHLNHANELLMKSFLIKNGYVVEYLEKSDINNGLKEADIINSTRTLDYGNCLKLVVNHLRKNGAIVDESRKQMIMDFYKIRNEIQHRATNIPLDKREKIGVFYPHLKGLYETMFSDLMEKI